MRTRPCCWVSYDKLRPRTKLEEKPLSLSGWIHDGGHGPGLGPGAYAEIQLHGHDRQRYPYIGISEASWFSAQPRRMRLLSGHDQLVSSGFHLACWVVCSRCSENISWHSTSRYRCRRNFTLGISKGSSIRYFGSYVRFVNMEQWQFTTL